jgi:hypothetical protein
MNLFILLRPSVIGTAAILGCLGATQGPASVAGSASGSHAASHCDTANGRGTSLRDYIGLIVAGVGPQADRLRAATQLPSGSRAIVTVVTDNSVCTAAYNAQVRQLHNGDSTVVGPIGLVQVGSTRYVVEDIGRTAGEWELLDIYDSNLNYLESVTR